MKLSRIPDGFREKKLNITQEALDEFKTLSGANIEDELINGMERELKIEADRIVHKTLKEQEDLVYRLRKRAEIRRNIPNRKSVQENQPDRIADLLEESANRIEDLEKQLIKLAESNKQRNELDVENRSYFKSKDDFFELMR